MVLQFKLKLSALSSSQPHLITSCSLNTLVSFNPSFSCYIKRETKNYKHKIIVPCFLVQVRKLTLAFSANS